jgi:hypothetical protein
METSRRTLLIRRSLAGLFLLSGLSLPSQGAIALVSHKSAKDLTGAESTALASPGYESKAGNMIAVWVITYSATESVGVVEDSAGDAFKPATLRNGTWNGQWFYATNVKGDSFNVVTIRPKTTGRATFKYPAMVVLEYSGVGKSAAPVADVAGQQGSLNGSWTSAPFDVSAGQLLLVGIVTANGGKYTAPEGFTMEESYFTPASNKFSFAAFDQIASAAKPGSTASVKWEGTFQTTGAVLAFKPGD